MTETMWDAPNQQVVRPDESAPWEEGTGGSAGADPKTTTAEPAAEPQVDHMTKQQLLEHAETLELDVHEDMTKAEIRAAIDEADGG